MRKTAEAFLSILCGVGAFMLGAFIFPQLINPVEAQSNTLVTDVEYESGITYKYNSITKECVELFRTLNANGSRTVPCNKEVIKRLSNKHKKDYNRDHPSQKQSAYKRRRTG